MSDDTYRHRITHRLVLFPTLPEDLPDLLTHSATAQKQLVGLVLANPEDAFVKNEMLPRLRQWHFSSGTALFFMFFGYTTPPFQESGTDGDLVSAVPEFNDRFFVQAIEWIESKSSINYSGRTMVVLTAVQVSSSGIQLDFDWVLDFDIEGLIKSGVIEDIRVLFQQLINLAKAHPADDALWAIGDELSDNIKHEAFMSAVAKYIPFVTNAREISKAHTAFRVRDRRPKVDFV